MDLNDYYGSEWLTNDDIEPDEDTTVTITELEEVLMKDEQKNEVAKLAVHFAELSKPLVMNKTNARTIGGLYGTKRIEKTWIGKRVTLWVNHDVEYQGKVVSAIRIRSRAPRPAPKKRPAKKRTAKRATKKAK